MKQGDSVKQHKEPTENPESLYGRAVIAFVLLVMMGITAPFWAMVAGLAVGMGQVRVTW